MSCTPETVSCALRLGLFNLSFDFLRYRHRDE